MMLAVVVLCTLMISTIDLSQNLVFAQNTTSITPAPELADSNDDDSTSNENDNDDDNESNGSPDDNGNDNDSFSEVIMMTMMAMVRKVTPNKIHYQVKKMKLKMISSRQTHYWNK